VIRYDTQTRAAASYAATGAACTIVSARPATAITLATTMRAPFALAGPPAFTVLQILSTPA